MSKLKELEQKLERYQQAFGEIDSDGDEAFISPSGDLFDTMEELIGVQQMEELSAALTFASLLADKVYDMIDSELNKIEEEIDELTEKEENEND